MVYCGRRRVAAIMSDLLLKIVQNNARSRVRNLALQNSFRVYICKESSMSATMLRVKRLGAISRIRLHGHDDFYKEFIATKGRFEGQTVLT